MFESVDNMYVNRGSEKKMIADAHIHLPSPGWQGHDSFFSSVAEAVEYLRNAGTNAAIFNTWQGVWSKTQNDVDEANETALKLYDEFRGFLYPGVVLHPDYPDSSFRWMEIYRSRGMMWVGELVFHNHSHRYVDAPFMKLMEECAKHGHIVQLHCHEDVLELAGNFPEMQFVMSHIKDDKVLFAVANHPNLWLDISGMQGGLAIGRLERAVEILGTDRLLYGTDFDLYEPRAFIARVCEVIKDPQNRKKIFSGNLLRLLDIANARSMDW
jgi:predicted TIM-barrel fold metal-dependent hydrolase